jgi:type IV secretory pathway VirB3-like protein
MGTAIRDRALLIVMTTIFAVLALDISIPAVVLSLMAFSKLLVEADPSLFRAEGEAA